MTHLLALFLLGLLLLWWWDAMRAREAAVAASRRACRQFGGQFLDDTVVLRRIRLGRDRGGRPALMRLYSFEFSQGGVGRYAGYTRMLGRRVVAVHLDGTDGPSAIGPAALERGSCGDCS